MIHRQQSVFSFPQKAPATSLSRNDVDALDHLNLWKVYQDNYCEHKPSVTIQVHEEDWPSVGAWVWENFDDVSGISFLPYDSGNYKQAPYETISEELYNELVKAMPEHLDWNSLVEKEDNVEGTQTLACVALSCEL